MPLGEHVYCVAVAFKMTEQMEQQICIKFSVKLEHSSAETLGMIQSAVAIGNCWLAASSPQHARSCIMSLQRFLMKYPTIQVTQPPHSPDLVPCNFWLFLKLKSPLKGKRFQTISEIQENMMGQLMVVGRTVWSRKVPALKGTEAYCPVYNISCILYLLQ